MCHDNEEWWKVWRRIDLSVQNWHEKFDEFWPEHSKISKICNLMGCFWPKYIMRELTKYRGIMFDGTEYWCKVRRKPDLCFQKWHEECSKFSPEHVRKSKTCDFYWVVLFKVERKVYDLKIYRGVMCHDNEERCKIWRGIAWEIW